MKFRSLPTATFPGYGAKNILPDTSFPTFTSFSTSRSAPRVSTQPAAQEPAAQEPAAQEPAAAPKPLSFLASLSKVTKSVSVYGIN